MRHLLIFGGGYCGGAVAKGASGFEVEVAARDGTGTILFDAAAGAVARATHILTTVPPGPDADPVLALYAEAIAQAPVLRWIGYLSSMVVYGNRDGGWVDEDTPPSPSQPRGERRLAAEQAWRGFADRQAVDIFRLGGIYGPGRSAFDNLRAGTARRTIKPGHRFGRIHRDDIVRAVTAAMNQTDGRGHGARVLHLTDDEPAESADVVTEVARLMGVEPPPGIPFDAAALSPMARSFWAENRQVASQKTQAALGLRWLFPSYREGLAAIWAEESGQGPAQ